MKRIMKVLYFYDAGFECHGIIRANTEEEVLLAASQHARNVHGIEANTDFDILMRALIKEEIAP